MVDNEGFVQGWTLGLDDGCDYCDEGRPDKLGFLFGCDVGQCERGGFIDG